MVKLVVRGWSVAECVMVGVVAATVMEVVEVVVTTTAVDVIGAVVSVDLWSICQHAYPPRMTIPQSVLPLATAYAKASSQVLPTMIWSHQFSHVGQSEKSSGLPSMSNFCAW